MVQIPGPSIFCHLFARTALCLCFSLIPAKAQVTMDIMRFDAIGQEQGLPFATIESIHQDLNGFLWMAAQEGLVRYDGYQFESFTNDPNDPMSLSANTVRDLEQDGEGFLWVATQGGGLNRFDVAREAFEVWQHDEADPFSLSEDMVSLLFRDAQGSLWVGTENEGLCRFEDGRFIRYQPDPEDPKKLSPGRIRGITDAADGKLWVATASGLNLLDPDTGVCERYPLQFQDRTDNSVTALFRDEAKRLWVGSQHGVSCLDTLSGQWSFYDGGDVQLGRINAFLMIGEVLWVGTDSGIYVLEEGSNQLLAPPGFQTGTQTLISSMLRDRSGCVWLSTFGSGLLRAAPNSVRFTSWHEPFDKGGIGNLLVTNILEDQGGRLWVATLSGGILMRPPGSPLFQQFGEEAGLKESGFFNLHEARGGTLWASSGRGLYRLVEDPELRFENMRDAINLNDMTHIHDDTQGRLWVGTYSSGLTLFDPQSKKVLKHFQQEKQSTAGISGNAVMSLLMTKDETLWVATDNGLNRYEPESGTFAQFGTLEQRSGITNQTITDIYENDGFLWLGTNGGGINRFDTQAETVRHVIREQDGLPSDFVMGLQGDGRGHLWASTTNGLARINMESGAIRSYDEHDGLLSNDFVQGANFFSAGREMFFGSPNGMVSFFPDDVKLRSAPPPVVFTRFLTNNQRRELKRKDPSSPLERSISETTQLVLDHEQKVFTIEFSALDFIRPEKNRVAFRLLGFDDEWTYADAKRRLATYTNLDPGHYTLQVKGANADGNWSESPREMALQIKPHPFFSLPAKIIYALIVALVVLGYLRLQRIALSNARAVARRDRELARQERKHKKRLEKEVLARTAELVEVQKRLITQEKLASLGTLAAGVAHEIRNPLNFVTNFAEVINGYIEEMGEILDMVRSDDGQWREVRELLADMDESARGIKRHGRRAEDIVVNMLGFAQGRNTEFKGTDLNALVREYANLSFQSMRNRQDLPAQDLHFDMDAEVGMIPLDPQSLSRVILNLVNNAIEACGDRHEKEQNLETGYRGEVWVGTRKQGDEVYIRIRDNGLGIPKDRMPSIFRPFFTTKKEGINVGLGLAISYDIVVSQHGGQLEVTSEENVYTEALVILPAIQESGEKPAAVPMDSDALKSQA